MSNTVDSTTQTEQQASRQIAAAETESATQSTAQSSAVGQSPSPVASDKEPRNGGAKAPEREGQKKSRQAGTVTKTYAVPSLNPSEKWKSVYTLDDARKGVWQKPTQIIGNLLLAQSALLVSAHPHSMKSLAFLQATLEAAARQKVWGHFPTPNMAKTLFIETEDPPWLVQERIRGLTKGLGVREDEEVSGFHWICPGPFDLVKDVLQLAKLLDKLKPDFAVISTLQNIIPGRDLNEQSDMAPVSKVVLTLAREFCPFVMITHSTWEKKNKRALGSITQAANYATTLHFEKSGDQVKVTLDSKIGSEEEEFLLCLETEESSDVDKDGVERKKQEVRRLVYKPKKSPMKAKVTAAIKELGHSASAGEIALKAGVSDRYVRKVKAEDKKRSSQKASKPRSGGEENSSADGSADGLGGTTN